ncbi:MAG: hypothetical protein AAFN10_11290, partial [Bacteroidota bacterium]
MSDRIIKPSLFVLFCLIGFSLQAQDTYRKISFDFGVQPSVNAITQQLALWYPVLGQTQTELALIEIKTSPGGKHYLFQQTLQGQPVHEAQLKVNLHQSGRLSSIVGNLKDFQTIASIASG